MWTPATREQHSRSDLRYSTDLTDAEWAVLEPLLPSANPLGRPRLWSLRDIVNGIFFVLRGGVPWRLLPKDLPPRSTVNDYLRRWDEDRTLDRIHHALYVLCREQAGRQTSPTMGIIDSQSVKSAEKGGARLIRQGTIPARRSRARSAMFLSTRKAC